MCMTRTARREDRLFMDICPTLYGVKSRINNDGFVHVIGQFQGRLKRGIAQHRKSFTMDWHWFNFI